MLSILFSTALVGDLFAQPPDQAWQLRLEGRNSVTLPLSSHLDVGANYTFQVWVYPERRTQFTRILDKGIPDPNNSPNFALVLSLDSDGRVWYSQTTGAPGSGRGVYPPTVLPLNAWSHLAVTSDGTTIILYVNGVEAGRSGTGGPIPVNNLPLALGALVRESEYGCCGFAGFLRQFSVWNRALTAAEILGGMGRTLTGLETGLVGYWPLDDGAGYRIRDASPRQLHATIQHPSLTFQLNGVSTRTPQYQPYWIRTPLLAGNPFDWSAQPQPTHVVAEAQRFYPIDFDNDGDTDIVIADYWNPGLVGDAPMKAYRNNGHGQFTEATTSVFGVSPPAPRTATRGVVADFNHDGRADLFIGDFGADFVGVPSGGQNLIFIQTPDGRLVDETSTRLPAALDLAHDADGADVDGDGNLDLIFAGVYAPYKVKLMMNDGSGHFAVDSSRLPTDVIDKRALVTRFFDANGDGKPDLFLGLEETVGSVTDLLLLNDGTGHFRNMTSGALPARIGGAGCATVNAGVGDLNTDGKRDIVVTTFCDHYTEGGYQVLLNRGDGSFADKTPQWLPDSLIVPSPIYADAFPWLRTVQFADFNHDGKLDVIVQSLGQGRHRLYLNTGSRLMEVPEFLPNMDGSTNPAGGGPDIAVGDFDNDGRPDIVTMDSSFNKPGSIDTLYVGLSKRDGMPPASLLPPAPQILRMHVLNEASLSGNAPAPGSRVRIRVNGLGPPVPVVFSEAPGALPPTTLGGVTVTFDSVAGRLLSVSSTEIVAIIPFALAGKWVVSVQISYGNKVSLPTPIPLTPSNPQIYGTRMADGRLVAATWRIVSGVRVPVAGSLNWGERFAFRVTGAGQSTVPLADGAAVSEQPFSPALPFKVAVGLQGAVSQDLTIVSMTYAPDGLSGVVEVVADLPPVHPPAVDTGEFFVYNDRFNSIYNVWWPLVGTSAAVGACSYSVNPPVLNFSNAGGSQEVSVTAAPGCSWSAVASQVWTAFPSVVSGTGNGSLTVSVSTNIRSAPRSGSITVGGQAVVINQAECVSGCAFSDDPLLPEVTLIRAVHITELRGRIEALCVRYGLPLPSWTDLVLTGVRVKAVHLAELRSAVEAVYAAAGIPAPAFTDTGIVPGTTPVKKAHIEELRAAIASIE